MWQSLRVADASSLCLPDGSRSPPSHALSGPCSARFINEGSSAPRLHDLVSPGWRTPGPTAPFWSALRALTRSLLTQTVGDWRAREWRWARPRRLRLAARGLWTVPPPSRREPNASSGSAGLRRIAALVGVRARRRALPDQQFLIVFTREHRILRHVVAETRAAAPATAEDLSSRTVARSRVLRHRRSFTMVSTSTHQGHADVFLRHGAHRSPSCRCSVTVGQIERRTRSRSRGSGARRPQCRSLSMTLPCG